MFRFLVLLGLVFTPYSLRAAETEVPQTGDVAVQQLPDQRIVFTIITSGGHVSFAAGGNWSVIAMQSQPPTTVTAFQIPDEADRQTKDSTNLAVNLFQPDATQSQEVISKVKQEPTDGTYKGWALYRREAHQGETLYTIVDALSPMADVVCAVRLAWPHLAAHATGYDSNMEATFRSVLDSVQGGVGRYQLKQGEILRRPNESRPQ